MDDEPGLFELPAPPRPAPPVRSGRGRARETYARRVVVDVRVIDAGALRTEALRIVGSGIEIGGYDADDDEELLSPEEEIATGPAPAVQWCVEPTAGMWPLMESGAVRVDMVELAADEQGPAQVRVSWTVTVKIHDVEAVRELALAACPAADHAARAEIDRSFAAAWHWAAPPTAPMDGVPGVTWSGVEVVVDQVLARSRRRLAERLVSRARLPARTRRARGARPAGTGRAARKR